jgi:hypothetical protein
MIVKKKKRRMKMFLMEGHVGLGDDGGVVASLVPIVPH